MENYTDKKTSRINADRTKKQDMKKISVGAASVLLGTTIYLGGTAEANTDTAVNSNVDSTNENSKQVAQQQSDQQQQIQGKAVTLNTQSTSTQAQTQAQQNQPVANDAYQVNSHSVTVNDSPTDSNYGSIKLHVSMQVDPTKINDGNYIDVKLGAPVADGQYANYSMLPATNNAPVTVNGTTVGSITTNGDNGYKFYRVQFNGDLSQFTDPVINFDFYWRSLLKNGVTLQGYTNEKGITSYTPKNDLVIGGNTYTSGIKIPVKYIDPNNIKKEHNTTETMSYNVGTAHLWIVNPDGTQTLTKAPVMTDVGVVFSDKLSNDVTVKVEIPKNKFVTGTWMSDEQVKQEIIHALKVAYESEKIGTFLQGNNKIGLKLTPVDDGKIPEVTVESEQVTTKNGSEFKNYHLVIHSADPVSLGGQRIVFANVGLKSGIDFSPVTGVTSYQQEMASYKRYLPTQIVAGGKKGIEHDGWLMTDGAYKGPNISNQALFNYLINHEAAYVSVHDNGNQANNSGYDHNVPFGGSTDKDEGPVGFIVKVGKYNKVNSPAIDNNGNGTAKVAEVTLTVNYIDQATGKLLDHFEETGRRDTSADYSTAATIAKLEKEHYILIKDQTNGQPLSFGNSNETYTVYFGHATQQVTDSKNVTETVHYVFTDGKQAHKDYVASKAFSRTGNKDLVTGETNWNAWIPNESQFAPVQSPLIIGFTPNKEEIPAQLVTADSDSPEFTVTYTKNSANNSSDHYTDNPSQIHLNPSEGTASNGQNYGINGNRQSNGGGFTGNNSSAGVGSVTAGNSISSGQQTPTTAPQAEQQALPQTGNSESHGFFVALLSAILGLFGLSLKPTKRNE